MNDKTFTYAFCKIKVSSTFFFRNLSLYILLLSLPAVWQEYWSRWHVIPAYLLSDKSIGAGDLIPAELTCCLTRVLEQVTCDTSLPAVWQEYWSRWLVIPAYLLSDKSIGAGDLIPAELTCCLTRVLEQVTCDTSLPAVWQEYWSRWLVIPAYLLSDKSIGAGDLIPAELTCCLTRVLEQVTCDTSLPAVWQEYWSRWLVIPAYLLSDKSIGAGDLIPAELTCCLTRVLEQVTCDTSLPAVWQEYWSRWLVIPAYLLSDKSIGAGDLIPAELTCCLTRVLEQVTCDTSLPAVWQEYWSRWLVIPAYLLSDKSIGAGDLIPAELTCCLTRVLEQVTCDTSLPAVWQEYWSRWLVIPAYLLSDKSIGAGDLWYQLTCCLTRVLEQVTWYQLSLPAVWQEYWSRWLVIPAYLLSDKSIGAGDLWYQLTCCLTRVLEQVTWYQLSLPAVWQEYWSRWLVIPAYLLSDKSIGAGDLWYQLTCCLTRVLEQVTWYQLSLPAVWQEYWSRWLVIPAYLLSDKSIGAGDLWYQLTCCLTRVLEQVTWYQLSLPAVWQEYWSRWLVIPAYLLSDKSIGAGDLWYQLTCCLTRVLEQVTCDTSLPAVWQECWSRWLVVPACERHHAETFSGLQSALALLPPLPKVGHKVLASRPRTSGLALQLHSKPDSKLKKNLFFIVFCIKKVMLLTCTSLKKEEIPWSDLVWEE